MKYKSVLCILAGFVIISVILLAACAGESTTVTATKTITKTGTADGPGLVGPAPLTPHSLSVGWGQCLWCHPVPPNHDGRTAIEAICAECHAEGPQILQIQ